MTIELIPVLEIIYSNQGVIVPDKFPKSENSEIWDKYYEERYQKSGFKEKLIPYLKGWYYYKLSDISDNILTKLIIYHTQEFRDGKINRLQETCAFSGGYVLLVDGQAKHFPQCCGELSDIKYWENISNGKSSYHEEHPTPQIKFEGNKIIFDFSVDEFDEWFEPKPIEIKLTIDRIELKTAVAKAMTELQTFEQRLNKINDDEKLCIDNIGGLLIWDNGNYE
jgi:hypothetical protein